MDIIARIELVHQPRDVSAGAAGIDALGRWTQVARHKTTDLDANEEISRHSFACLGNHVQQKAGAPLGVTTVRIGAQVGSRTEEG